MLSKEFLVEVVQKQNWKNIGNKMIIGLSDHYFDRLSDRGADRTLDPGKYSIMTHSQILPSIEKLTTYPGMIKKMRRIPLGQQFYVIDHSNKVVLAMRRYMDQNGLMVNYMGSILTRLNNGNVPRIKEEDSAQPVLSMP